MKKDKKKLFALLEKAIAVRDAAEVMRNAREAFAQEINAVVKEDGTVKFHPAPGWKDRQDVIEAEKDSGTVYTEEDAQELLIFEAPAVLWYDDKKQKHRDGNVKEMHWDTNLGQTVLVIVPDGDIGNEEVEMPLSEIDTPEELADLF